MAERVRAYRRDKEYLKAFIIVASILTVALLLLFITLKLNDDKWICKDGEWIEQGKPSEPKPNSKCE